MRNIALFGLILLAPTLGWAGDDGMAISQTSTLPAISCSLTYSTDPSPRGWRGNQTTAFGALTTEQTDTTVSLDPYLSGALSRSRNSHGDWTTTFALSKQGGMRLYTLATAGNGCARTHEVAVPQGQDIRLSMTDDSPRARTVRQCLIVENTSDGSRLGVNLSCTQQHNAARDRERALEAGAHASGGGSQKSSGSAQTH